MTAKRKKVSISKAKKAVKTLSKKTGINNKPKSSSKAKSKKDKDKAEGIKRAEARIESAKKAFYASQKKKKK